MSPGPATPTSLMPRITVRPATQDDARFLVPLIDAAGEGLPSYLWARLAQPGQIPAEVGLARVEGETATVSWRHARVAEFDGRPAGCCYACRLPDPPATPTATLPGDLPPMFVPLQQLENEAAGTGYINILATASAFRRRGVGRALLASAEETAGPRGMSVIVSDGNPGARRLYERLGYAVTDRRPMVKEGWRGHGRAWLLMIKAP